MSSFLVNIILFALSFCGPCDRMQLKANFMWRKKNRGIDDAFFRSLFLQWCCYLFWSLDYFLLSSTPAVLGGKGATEKGSCNER